LSNSSMVISWDVVFDRLDFVNSFYLDGRWISFVLYGNNWDIPVKNIY
jgi:hypothetical protein